MKITLLFRPPENRTEDYWYKFWSTKRVHPNNQLAINLYLFRFIPFLLVLFLAGYLVTALLLFTWVNRKPQEDVGYLDVLLLPLSYEEFQKKRGRIFIESGKAALEQGRIQEGVWRMKIGLGKYPEDQESRTFLAHIYYMAGLVDPSMKLLKNGVKIGTYDADFLKFFFDVAYQSDSYKTIMEVLDILEEDPAFTKNEINIYMIQRHRVTALLELGRPEEALIIAQQINSVPDAKFRMIDAEFLALQKLEKPIDALILLEKWKLRLGTQNPQLQNLFIDAYIALGDEEKIEKSINNLINIDRQNPNLRLHALKKWHDAGNQEQLWDTFLSYLLLFGWKQEALNKINNFVTSIHQVEMVEEILSLARKRSMNQDTILFNLYYAYLMEGRWQDAAVIYEQLQPALETFAETDQLLIGIGQTVVQMKNEENERLQIILLQDLRKLRSSITFYLTMNKILQKSELYEIAVEALAQAQAMFPQSPRINTSFYKAISIANEYNKNNAPIVIEETLDKSPEEYLKQIDELIALGNPNEAENIIDKIYRVAPPWLEGTGDDFEYRKLKLYFETRDLSFQSLSTTLFVANNPNSGPELLQLALTYLDDGRDEQSRMIAEELVKNNPRNIEARNLLEQLGGSNEEELDKDLTEPDEERKTYLSKQGTLDKFRRALANDDFQTCQTIIQGVLHTKPSWLRTDRTSFDILHIEYYLRQHKFIEARPLVRLYMGNDFMSAKELIALGNKLQDEQLNDASLFLEDFVQSKYQYLSLEEE